MSVAESALPPPPAAVAVLTPVAPATAWATRAPSMDWPVALAPPLRWSNDSVIPPGGVQFCEDEYVW